MKLDLVKIKFCFPDIAHAMRSKRELVRLLMEEMRRDGSIKYAGYLKEEGLCRDLLRHIGSGDITQYKKLSTRQKQIIEKTIQ